MKRHHHHRRHHTARKGHKVKPSLLGRELSEYSVTGDEEELPLDHTIPPPLRDIGKARVKTIKGHKVKPDPVELDRFA